MCFFEKLYRKCLALIRLFRFLFNPANMFEWQKILHIFWKKCQTLLQLAENYFFILKLFYQFSLHICFKTGLVFFPEKSAVKNMRSLIVILMFIYPWPVCSLSKFTLFWTSLSIILWFWWIVKIHLEKVSSILMIWHTIYVCLIIEIKVNSNMFELQV